MSHDRTWRLLPLASNRAAHHMALDEALLELGDERPVLRLYTWEPLALSLGWFQDERAVLAARTGVPSPHDPSPHDPSPHDIVRRFTGGGAIHHAAELTFSIAAPLTHPLYAGPVAAGYERVHGAITRALAQLGVEAFARGDAHLSSERAGTGLCFHQSSAVDLVWQTPNGLAKGVGSAQRRRGGRVLHHGSIKLGHNPHEPGVATVWDVCDTQRVQRCAEALLHAMSEEFGARFEADTLQVAEELHVARRSPYFGSAANLAVQRRARRDAASGASESDAAH